MKKFLIVVLAVVIAAAVTYTATGSACEGMIEKAEKAELGAKIAKVEVYSTNADDDYTYASTGAFYVYGCDLNNAGIIAAKVGNILGTAVFYDAETELSKVLDAYKAEKLSVQKEKDFTIVYAYSEGCGKGVVTDGMTVNLQIVIKGDSTIVGSPLIMGSY